MVGEKELHFQGKGTDLAELQGKVESYLQGEGFTVQTSAPSEQGTVIQPPAPRGRRAPLPPF